MSNTHRHTLAIIGAGASGLMCALRVTRGLYAARDQVRIIVLEAAPKPGRSILVSGNGRCNFSNGVLTSHEDRTMYHEPAFVAAAAAALKEDPSANVLALFRSLGLVWREERDGMLFPYANKATAVLDVLLGACERAGIEIACEHRVTSVTKTGEAFQLMGEQGVETARQVTAKGRVKRTVEWQPFELVADCVVVAAGGEATRALLPGHGWHPQRWVLGPLKTDQEALVGLDGVRTQVRLSVPGKTSEEGEVLFRPYGISGIVSFNASRYCTPGDELVLDFLPDYDQVVFGQLMAYVLKASGVTTLDELFAGTFAAPVRSALFARAGLRGEVTPTLDDALRVVATAKHFVLRCHGLAEDQSCQVRRGGCPVDEVDAQTMASTRTDGLYVLGEALDVDGPCGGYNLDWAWTSGILAAASITARLS